MSEKSWEVIPKPGQPGAELAAEFTEKFLNHAWQDPRWRAKFWAEYRRRLREAIERGEL